jgi:hypothetical protein
VPPGWPGPAWLLHWKAGAFDTNKEEDMKTLIRHALFAGLASLGLAAPAFAQDAMVTISSPAEGAKLAATAPLEIVYDVTPGPRGDHTHLYVDGNEAAVLRQLKGSHKLEPLAAGPHELCIKVVNKNHTPIGVDKCVKLDVQ